jgi:hypothetical protein
MRRRRAASKPSDGAKAVDDGPRIVTPAHRRRGSGVPVGSEVGRDRVGELIICDCVAGEHLELDEPGERRNAPDLAG